MKEWIFRWIFEELIPFKWINGNKTNISRFATLIFAVATLVGQFFPEYLPFISQGQALLLTVLGLVGIEIGKEHREIKKLEIKEG